MAESLHPAASHHLPIFITAPGETDVLMVVMGVILALSVLAFGILFLRLHSLPERIAHKTHKTQFEIVAILCLIALFTHMHIFWIAALLLAFIDLPDFGGSLSRIAGSTEKIAGIRSPEEASDGSADSSPYVEQAAKVADASPQIAAKPKPSGGVPTKPELAPTLQKEPVRA